MALTSVAGREDGWERSRGMKSMTWIGIHTAHAKLEGYLELR